MNVKVIKHYMNWRYIMPATIFLSPQFYEVYKSSYVTFIILPSSVVIKSESRLCPKQGELNTETRNFNLCEVGIWPWMWIQMHHSTLHKLGGQKQFSVCWLCKCNSIIFVLSCYFYFRQSRRKSYNYKSDQRICFG